MKKKLSIFVIVAALVLCLVPFAFAEGESALTVTPSATSVQPGDTITVTVAIVNNPGHASGEVLMSASEGLTLTALEAVVADPDADEYPAMELNPETGLISWSCASKITGDIDLFTATYTLAADAAAGDYTITAASRESYSFRSEYDPTDGASGAIIPVLSGSATVTVEEPVSDISVVKSTGSVAIDFSVEGQVVTVTHTDPCKVGYLVDGAYVAVPVTDNGDGSYSYNVPEGITEVVLVVKGDATGDGRLNAGDYARIKAVQLGNYTTATDVALFAADVTGDGRVNAGDFAKVKAAILGNTAITW